MWWSRQLPRFLELSRIELNSSHATLSSNSSREDGEVVAKLSIQSRLQSEPIWKSGSSLTFPCAAFYDGAIAG